MTILLTPGWSRRPPVSSGRPVRWLLALALIPVSGCVTVRRQTLVEPEQRAFRAAALQFLKQQALSERPLVAIQVVEAFREVAPDDGILYIVELARRSHPGVASSALMALGALRHTQEIELMRTKAEHTDPNVQVWAIFAMHRCGDQRRTGDLGRLLINHPDVRVRANAALALGRLGEPTSARVLQMALRRERKKLATHHLYEALATLGDRGAINQLLLLGYSTDVNDATEAVMMLANARCQDAEPLFLDRLERKELLPETRLHAARGLGRIGMPDARAVSIALQHLVFRSPRRAASPADRRQKIEQVRVLAALALGELGDPGALGPLRTAFDDERQGDLFRVAIARAAIGIIDRRRPRRSAD